MKNNILGEDGCINKSGILGTSSYMFNVCDENFWDNIEEYIKPLVKVLVNHNIETFSSCQGHYNEEKKFNGCANVSFYIDDKKHIHIERAVKRFENVFYTEVKDVKINRKINRIVFDVSPQNREALNELILNFSNFIDEYLTIRKC